MYKVISKPAKWGSVCRFVDQIGNCVGTDKNYGVKLRFLSGEITYIPFENVEFHDSDKYKKSSTNLPVVAMEPERNKYYNPGIADVAVYFFESITKKITDNNQKTAPNYSAQERTA